MTVDTGVVMIIIVMTLDPLVMVFKDIGHRLNVFYKSTPFAYHYILIFSYADVNLQIMDLNPLNSDPPFACLLLEHTQDFHSHSFSGDSDEYC